MAQMCPMILRIVSNNMNWFRWSRIDRFHQPKSRDFTYHLKNVDKDGSRLKKCLYMFAFRKDRCSGQCMFAQNNGIARHDDLTAWEHFSALLARCCWFLPLWAIDVVLWWCLLLITPSSCQLFETLLRPSGFTVMRRHGLSCWNINCDC